MALNVNGKFRVGGVEHHHPLTSEEIEFVLRILAETEFKGHMLNNLIAVTMKLQKEYEQVKHLEDTLRKA